VLAGQFGPVGVWAFNRSNANWQTLHSCTPVLSLAADYNGSVFASFPGFAVYEFNPSAGWRVRTYSTANLIGLGY